MGKTKESTEIKNLVLSMHTTHPKDLPVFAEQFWSKEPGVDWFGNAKTDRVVVRGTTHGTHTGAFMGIQPTAKEVALPWIGIFRLVAGKIVEAWFEINDRILFH